MPINERSTFEKVQMAGSIAKSANEVLLFPFFSTEKLRQWLEALNTLNKVVNFLLKIFLVVVFILSAILKLIELAITKNRNLDLLFSAFMTNAGAIAASSAIIGMLAWGAAFTLLGLSGPWLFMLSLGMRASELVICIVRDSYRAFMAPASSHTRAHYLQAVSAHILHLLAVCLATLMVVAVFISPVGAALAFGLTMAATAAALVAVVWYTVAWLKPGWTKAIKNWLGLGKPNEQALTIKQIELPASGAQPIKAQFSGKHTFVEYNIFKRDYHKDKVFSILDSKSASCGNDALDYLQQALENKIKKIMERDPKSRQIIANKSAMVKDASGKTDVKQSQQQARNGFTKNQQKKLALDELAGLLMSTDPTIRTEEGVDEIINKYPKIFQSVFADVSDTEDLCNAIKLYLRYNHLTILPQATIPLAPKNGPRDQHHVSGSNDRGHTVKPRERVDGVWSENGSANGDNAPQGERFNMIPSL